MIEPAFNQVQVQSSIGLDFAAGMKSLLRQDPDIIMVGEIRDKETADMAVQAALTVIWWSVRCTQTTPRVRSLGCSSSVCPLFVARHPDWCDGSAFNPNLCPHCKTEAPLDAEVWREFIAHSMRLRLKRFISLWGASIAGRRGLLAEWGCMNSCQSRTSWLAAFMPICQSSLARPGMEAGLEPLRLAGAKRVAAGLTTLEEVGRVTPPL